MRHQPLISTFLMFVLPALSTHALEAPLLWTHDAHMVIESAPIVVDLNGDGDAEIVTAAYEHLIAVDGSGEELWRFDSRGRYSTCVAVLERRNELPLLFAGDNTGLFTCVDGGGTVVWQAETPPVFCASAAIADLDGKGGMEVVQGDKTGGITAFDALTGAVVWKATVEGECSSVAAADLTQDGRPEVVVTTGAGKLCVLSPAGSLLWQADLAATTQDWATCSPVVWWNADGEARVATASGKESLLCFDAHGSLLWSFKTRGAVASSLSAADYEDDGRMDLFALTQLGVLYRLDEEGRMLWEMDTQGRGLAPAAIVDVDGNGALNLALCTQNGSLFVFGQQGEVLFHHQFDNRTINTTPAFGDIVASRPGLEFAVTGGESGRIFCFGAQAAVDTAAPWRTYRADNTLRGAAADDRQVLVTRMDAENLTQEQILVGRPVVFHIDHPRPTEQPLVAQALCVDPCGVRQTAISKIHGSTGVLELPVTVNCAGPHTFSWSLKGEHPEPLSAGEITLELKPFENDFALALRAQEALRDLAAAAAPASPLGTTATRELAEIAEQTTALAPAQQGRNGDSPNEDDEREIVLQRTAALNHRAGRALRFAALAKPLAGKGGGQELVVFEGTTWENRGIDQQMPERAEPLAIRRRSVPGEHEPVSLKLFNLTGAAVLAQCRIAGPGTGVVVTPYEVKGVPSNQNITAWDPMVPLEEAGILIPALESREVWLDINLEDAAAGTHPIGVLFTTRNMEIPVKISLEVLPFEMAGSGAIRLCAWASYNEHAVKDLLAHNGNVFITSLPPATISPDADSAPALDFTALDKFLAPLRGHDVFLLFNGMPDLGAALDTDDYVPRMRAYLEIFFAHLEAQGFDASRVGLYPHDEPGGHGWDTVNHYIAFARQALKARPGLQFYVNGGGDLPMFEALREVAGIWSPPAFMLAEDSPEMRVMRSSNKLLWSYDCFYAFSRPIGANTKTTNLVAQYWLAAVAAVRYNATGIGFWSYNIGPSNWEADWNEYPIVYTNPDGSITPCRRWEAVREGMEDARILVALRERLQDTTLSAEARSALETLFEDTLPAVCDPAMEQARVGVARYVLDDTNNDATVEHLRRAMLDAVELLIKSAGA